MDKYNRITAFLVFAGIITLLAVATGCDVQKTKVSYKPVEPGVSVQGRAALESVPYPVRKPVRGSQTPSKPTSKGNVVTRAVDKAIEAVGGTRLTKKDTKEMMDGAFTEGGD